MNISYDYYKAFYYVAKNKSFTKAAEELFAEQPNVTRTVKALEAQLGCLLFYRSKRRVELTPEGEKLYRHIRIAFEHIRLGEEEIAQDKSLRGGVIAIGASETALYGLLLPALKDFRTRHSDMRLKVGNYSTTQALAALKDGFVDFAVVTAPLDTDERLVAEEIKTFRETAVYGDCYSGKIGARSMLKAFSEFPVVGLGRSTKTYDFYTELFASHGLTYRVDIEVATADQLLPMIRNNLGVGFVPEFFMTGIDGVHTAEIAETVPERSICLVRRTDRPLSIAAQKLFDEIKSRKN